MPSHSLKLFVILYGKNSLHAVAFTKIIFTILHVRNPVHAFAFTKNIRYSLFAEPCTRSAFSKNIPYCLYMWDTVHAVAFTKNIRYSLCAEPCSLCNFWYSYFISHSSCASQFVVFVTVLLVFMRVPCACASDHYPYTLVVTLHEKTCLGHID